MTKLKICGIYREQDCQFMNEIQPDYVGFILGVAKSHRNVDFQQFLNLEQRIQENIKKVGVFVNEKEEIIEKYSKYLDVIQLHGSESQETVAEYRKIFHGKEIWKAFQIVTKEDLIEAEKSCADLVLLDGKGGGGEPFDWNLFSNFSRDFALAGGISIHNISQAISTFSPKLIDLSSSVETDKKKDILKLRLLKEAMNQ